MTHGFSQALAVIHLIEVRVITVSIVVFSDVILPTFLGSTQPPIYTKMSARNISGGVGLTTLPPSCATSLGLWEL